MRRLSFCIVLLLAATASAQRIVGPVGTPRPDRPAAPPVDPAAIDAATDRAVTYLLSQITDDGRVVEDYPPENPRFGGRTMLTIYALLQAGVDPDRNETLRRAITWAMQAKLKGTYAVGFRCAAMSRLKDLQSLRVLQADVQWLIRAAGPKGRYTYTPAEPGRVLDDYDNSNGHIAAFGVWSAQTRGVDIPLAYWKRVQEHWLAEQQSDGGWGYRLGSAAGGSTTQTYGSMTAAGVVTLHECLDALGRDHFIRCRPLPHGEAIDRGVAWLDKNFSPRLNPRKGVEWYSYWLFCIQRVGQLTGRQMLGDVDWYAAGAHQLLKRQHDDGSWGFGSRTDSTAFALLFLAHGRAPTLLSKISRPGRWNARPRDAANLVRWLDFTYEQKLGWHVIDINADADSWDAARILYFSGAGPIALSDAQVDRLRQFVLRGGLILSEAACNNGDFTMDMHRIYQRMFPDYRFEPLTRSDPQHPIYSLRHDNVAPQGLFTIHNGVRPLAIHAPEEISLALELGPGETRRPTFDLVANLYLYLTDMAAASPRGEATWPDAPEESPRGTLRLARLKYKGNCDPEPLAFKRLALMLAREQQIELKVSDPLDIASLSVKDWPVAHITGTSTFTLTETERAALRTYLAQGGTLIADAAGGSSAFSQSLLAVIGDVVDRGKLMDVPQTSGLYRDGPYDVFAVQYRRGMFEGADIRTRSQPHLKAVYLDERPAIIYSLEDISAGLVGYPLVGLRGYTPTSARQVMANLLLSLHNRRTPKASAAAAPTHAPNVTLDADADATVTEVNE